MTDLSDRFLSGLWV